MRRFAAERLEAVGAYLVLALGVCLAFGSTLLPSRLLLHRDHSIVFRGRWWWVVERLSNFELPTRTIGNHTEVPVESIMNGAYTPMTAIFALFDFDVAYDLFVAGHVLLGCAGIYTLARSLGASREGAILSGAFGLAGPVLSFENLVHGLQGIVWIPWVLFAVHRFLVTKNIRWVGLFALFAGFHLQAMMPETALLDVVAGFALVAYTRRSAPLDRRAFLWLALGTAIALAIASVGLVPPLTALASGKRGAGFSAAEATVWSLHPAQLLEMGLPVFFHSPDLPFAIFPDMIGNRNHTPYLYSLYFGAALPVTFVALFADDVRTRRFARGLLLLALLFVGLSMGQTLPFYRWLQALPLFENSRYPVKYMVLVTAALAAVAPAGYATLSKVRWAPFVFVPSVLLALITMRLLSMPEIVEAIGSALRPDPAPGFAFGIGPADYVGPVTSEMGASATHALIVGAIALVLCFVGRRVARIWPLLVVLIVCDLGLAGSREIVGVRAEPGPTNEVVEALSDPHYRNYTVVPGLRFPRVQVRDDETPREAQLRDARARGNNLIGVVRTFDDQDNDGLSNPASGLAYRIVNESRGNTVKRILARAGVAFVSSHVRPPVEGVRAYEIPEGVPQWIGRIESVRDYAAIHPRWEQLDIRALPMRTIAQRLAATDKANVAFVSSEPVPASTATSSTAEAECLRSSRVTLVETTESEHIALDVELACPSLVSVLEVHMPRWRATLDGTEVPIHDVDFGFMAVRAEPGKHRIDLVYDGAAPRWAIVSGIAALFAFALVGIGRAKR